MAAQKPLSQLGPDMLILRLETALPNTPRLWETLPTLGETLHHTRYFGLGFTFISGYPQENGTKGGEEIHLALLDFPPVQIIHHKKKQRASLYCTQRAFLSHLPFVVWPEDENLPANFGFPISGHSGGPIFGQKRDENGVTSYNCIGITKEIYWTMFSSYRGELFLGNPTPLRADEKPDELSPEARAEEKSLSAYGVFTGSFIPTLDYPVMRQFGDWTIYHIFEGLRPPLLAHVREIVLGNVPADEAGKAFHATFLQEKAAMEAAAATEKVTKKVTKKPAATGAPQNVPVTEAAETHPSENTVEESTETPPSTKRFASHAPEE